MGSRFCLFFQLRSLYVLQSISTKLRVFRREKATYGGISYYIFFSFWICTKKNCTFIYITPPKYDELIRTATSRRGLTGPESFQWLPTDHETKTFGTMKTLSNTIRTIFIRWLILQQHILNFNTSLAVLSSSFWFFTVRGQKLVRRLHEAFSTSCFQD